MFNVSDVKVRISKFEMDFSKVMLSSVVMLFVQKPLEDYLNMFWNYFTSTDCSEPLDAFLVHVCR